MRNGQAAVHSPLQRPEHFVPCRRPGEPCVQVTREGPRLTVQALHVELAARHLYLALVHLVHAKLVQQLQTHEEKCEIKSEKILEPSVTTVFVLKMEKGQSVRVSQHRSKEIFIRILIKAVGRVWKEYVVQETEQDKTGQDLALPRCAVGYILDMSKKTGNIIWIGRRVERCVLFHYMFFISLSVVQKVACY